MAVGAGYRFRSRTARIWWHALVPAIMRSNILANEEKTIAQFISTIRRGPTGTDGVSFDTGRCTAAGNARGCGARFLFLVSASTQPAKCESAETENDCVEVPDAAALRQCTAADPAHGCRHFYLRAGLGHGLGKELHGE